jgi:hypothetical protein
LAHTDARTAIDLPVGPPDYDFVSGSLRLAIGILKISHRLGIATWLLLGRTLTNLT